MAIKLLDMGAGLTMAGLIIPNLVFLSIAGQMTLYLEIWANIGVAFVAGSMILANFIYWLDEKSIGPIANSLHVIGSVIGLIAGGVTFFVGINFGIVPLIGSLVGNSMDLIYTTGTLELILPIGPFVSLVGGIFAFKICLDQLAAGLAELKGKGD